MIEATNLSHLDALIRYVRCEDEWQLAENGLETLLGDLLKSLLSDGARLSVEQLHMRFIHDTYRFGVA